MLHSKIKNTVYSQMGTFAETAIVYYHYHTPTKENKVPFLFQFAANKRKLAFSVSRLQQTNERCCFPLAPLSVCGILELLRHGLVTGRW
jgi:hypothetical protein